MAPDSAHLQIGELEQVSTEKSRERGSSKQHCEVLEREREFLNWGESDTVQKEDERYSNELGR